jgi:hypothetical protein
MVSVALLSDGEAAVAAEPGDGPLDGPTVAAQAGRGLDAAAGDAVTDPAFMQGPVAVGDVVCLVGVELRGFAAARSAPRLDLRDALHQRFESLAVVEVGGRDAQGQRRPVPAGEDVELRAGLATIDRV